MKKVETTMANLPRLWEEDYAEYRKYFTVGRGKAQYCLWIFGASGLAYCFSVSPEGYACNRRAIEPNAAVFLHIEM